VATVHCYPLDEPIGCGRLTPDVVDDEVQPMREPVVAAKPDIGAEQSARGAAHEQDGVVDEEIDDASPRHSSV
jgi:hypothetical protein